MRLLTRVMAYESTPTWLHLHSICSVQGCHWHVQGLLGGIRDKQRKLQEAHERTKTVTRTGEMKGIRERMQARSEAQTRAKHALACLARPPRQSPWCPALL